MLLLMVFPMVGIIYLIDTDELVLKKETY